jgi:thioredoxin reductase
MDNKATTRTDYEYLIIGAGPAGLQLAYFLHKAGHAYYVLEAGDRPGTFFKTFPRHRTLISNNKVFTGCDDPEINLRWDWNSLLSDDYAILMKQYSQAYFPPADTFVQYLGDFAQHYHLNIGYNSRVEKITKATVFTVTDANGLSYTAERLIVATGWTQQYIPPIPGIELVEKYSNVSVDPQDFAGQRVLIIGKGNSALETAENLLETAALIHVVSPHRVRLAWQTHYIGDLRAVNNNFLDTYQLKMQNALLDADIDAIVQTEGCFTVSLSYAHANGEKEDLVYDRVILCAGWSFDASIFDEHCRPALTINNRFPDLTSEWESTTIRDLYFAGTLMHMRDYKESTAGFIHGYRYAVEALYRILECKYAGQAWPNYTIGATPDEMTAVVLKRVNRTSALWQMFSFLGDLIVVSEEGSQATYYEHIPVDYVFDTLGQHEHYYIVTLEYGLNHTQDPFNVTRVQTSDTDRANQSNFLHPVIRRYQGKTLLAEHHLMEDLAANWSKKTHREPLRAFFESDTAKVFSD